MFRLAPPWGGAPFRAACRGAALLAAAGLWALAGPLSAQEEPKRQSLEKRVRELEKRVRELEETPAARIDREEFESHYSRGIVTLGGLRFRLGGDLRIDLIDPQNEADPIFGSTENPDPHLEVDKLRISPRIDIPRLGAGVDVYLRAQIDFHPTDGDTILKEATFDVLLQPEWWMGSHFKVGLDDRFIRPQRLTQNYPLIGTAFWRDESVGLFWEGTLGDSRGSPPEEERPRRGRRRDEQAGGPAGGPDRQEQAADEEDSREPAPQRSARTRSTEHAPFDFRRNWGAVKVNLSLSDGLTLNDQELGKDEAFFQQILQDDRDLDPPLKLREAGGGLGYERDFRELGEIEVAGFYYDDELNDRSVEVLQDQLTERDPLTLAPIRGYGDSDSRKKNFWGFNVGYHWEAFHLWEALGLTDVLNPRPGDGLNLFFQWITAEDGELEREGWYVQASYRISNPYWRRYLFRFEPVIRYGELDPDIERIPSLPLTWKREQLLVGAVVGVVRDVFIRAEYTINDESTGAASVDNNELLVQLLCRF